MSKLFISKILKTVLVLITGDKKNREAFKTGDLWERAPLTGIDNYNDVPASWI